MAKAVSDETRIKEKRGTGTGANYKPWIKISEYRGKGICTEFPDWKHGRRMEFTSQGQRWWYTKLRWNDDIVDIRENYPLPKEETSRIARELGYRVYACGRKHMLTDLLVTLSDGSTIALSILSFKSSLSDRRIKEKLYIERQYWKELGIRWHLVFSEDLNPVELRNIDDVMSTYGCTRCWDKFCFVRYLIAHKIIQVDMTREIDYLKLIAQLEGEETWKKYSFLLE